MTFLHSRRIQFFCLAFLVVAVVAMYILSTDIRPNIRSSNMQPLMRQTVSNSSSSSIETHGTATNNNSSSIEKSPAHLFQSTTENSAKNKDQSDKKDTVSLKDTSKEATESPTAKDPSVSSQLVAQTKDSNRVTRIRLAEHFKKKNMLVAVLDFEKSMKNPFSDKKIRHYSFVNSYTYVIEFGAPWSSNLPDIEIESLPDAVKSAKVGLGDANQLRLIIQTKSKQATRNAVLQIKPKDNMVIINLTFPGISSKNTR